MKVIIIASEVPFVGDDPVSIQEKAKKVDFLKDHWPYNVEELVRVLDKCFAWKSEDSGREVLMLGRDIHCGVTSDIRDRETELTIQHLTTSPITNHVCRYFPELEGEISERYSYSHLPLGETDRNYADISIDLEYETDVTARLRRVKTNMFSITDYMSGDEES